MNAVQMVLVIIVMNMVYVSLSTIRMILVMKSRQGLATVISMFEVFIYLMALNIVLSNIDKPINLIAYCLGWGGGVWLGIKIEGWLALGYSNFQIIVDHTETKLPHLLREKGYGVTTWIGDGRDGQRLVMQVLAKRKNEKKLLDDLYKVAPKAFILSYEPRSFKGGFWTKKLKS